MTPEELIIKALENVVMAKKDNDLTELLKIALPILGTLIAAFLGFRATLKQTERNFAAQIKTALLSRNTELDAQFLEIKLKHYMEVQDLIDQFANIVTDYCANVRNWNDHKRDSNNDSLYEHEKKHSKLQDDFYKGFLLLASAESKLLILRKSAAHQIFQSLNATANTIYQSVYLDQQKVDKWDEYNQNILALVEEFKEDKRQLMSKIGDELNQEHHLLLNKT